MRRATKHGDTWQSGAVRCPANGGRGLKSAALLLAVALVCGASLFGFQQPANSCLDCHGSLSPPLQIDPDAFRVDIHAAKGLDCSSCHGGNPKIQDMQAMSPKEGFRGKPKHADIPAFCARCHSDPAYMHKFNPTLRTDQLSEYKTSVHGKRLAAGDTKVAVCTSCHKVHEIRTPDDGKAWIYPQNVPQTCARCHADANYMKGYGIPTNQYAEYRTSVHYEKLAQGGDLSAPNCATCHGSHGATPPGVASVELVCENCHDFQAQYFDKSPHKQAFATAGLPGCESCHGNHAIVQPTDQQVSTQPGSFCLKCHVEGDAGYAAAAAIHKQLVDLQAAMGRSQQILTVVSKRGMEVSQGQQELSSAFDSLTKARVDVHSVQPADVEADTSKGLKSAEAAYVIGQQAVTEMNFRRKGLAIALSFIVVVLIGLWLQIRKRNKERP